VKTLEKFSFFVRLMVLGSMVGGLCAREEGFIDAIGMVR